MIALRVASLVNNSAPGHAGQLQVLPEQHGVIPAVVESPGARLVAGLARHSSQPDRLAGCCCLAFTVDLANRQLELGLILADAVTFRRLFEAPDPVKALLFFPHLCMFAVESFDYLRKHGMVKGSFGPHAPTIARARHSLKFLDDTRDVVRDALERYESIVRINHSMFVGAHRGVLGPLKRSLQPDLGLNYFDGRLVGTTHSVMTQLGLDDDHLAGMNLRTFKAGGPTAHERARVLGQYLATLLETFGYESQPEPIVFHPLKTVDVKARRFYGAILRSDTISSLGVAALLTSLLCSSNVVTYLLPQLIDIESQLQQWTVLKWRLVTLFHVASSLRHVTATRELKNFLRPDVARALVELRRRVRFVHKLKKLRDSLVHYDVEGRSIDGGLSPPERLASRFSKQIRVETENGLVDTSRVLSELMPRARVT